MTLGDCIGLALQVLGILGMGLGVWRTWREFAMPGQSFVDPITIPVREALLAIGSRIHAIWLRMLRRRQHVEGHAEVALGHGAAFGARGRVDYGPLDTSNLEDAARELERRIGQLVARLASLDERVQDERKADLAAISELRDSLGHAISELEARDRRVALGGLRLEMLGLLLTVAGLVLQTVA